MTFQLNPVEETDLILKKNKVVESNKKILELVKLYYPAYDAFVREVIDLSLPKADIDLETLNILGDRDYIKKNGEAPYKKAVEEAKEKIAMAIAENMPEGFKEIKKIDSAEFVKKVLPKYIKKACGDDADKLIDGIDMPGLSSMLSKYAISRITSFDKAADRYIENFEIYIRNAKIYRDFVENCDKAEELIDNYPESESIRYVSYYINNVTQEQIDSYNNFISGIFEEDGNVKFVGYNQFVNIENQKNRSNKDYKGRVYKEMDYLKKQILAPTKTAFSIPRILDDNGVRETVLELDKQLTTKNVLEIAQLIKTTPGNEIYMAGRNVRSLSHELMGDFKKLYNMLVEKYESDLAKALETAETKKEQKNIRSQIANSNVRVNESLYSIEQIQEVCGSELNIRHGFNKLLSKIIDNILDARKELFSSQLLEKEFRTIKGSEKNTLLIKNYLESFTELRNFVKMINPKDAPDEAVIFCNQLKDLTNDLGASYKAENLVRNYITKKVGALRTKEVMTFGMPTIFNNKWWADGEKLNKDNYIILMEDNKIYLAIPSETFKNTVIKSDEDTGYYGIQFKNKAKAGQNLVRCLYTKEVTSSFEKGEEIGLRTDKMTSPMQLTRDFYMNVKGNKLYAAEALKKGLVTEEERRGYLADYINILKEFMRKNEEWNIYDIDSLKDASEYDNYAQFADDVQSICLKTFKIPVDKECIYDLARKGDIYLFQVYARDLGLNKKNKYGPSQMLEYILSDENIEKMTARIAGGLQIYFSSANPAAQHIEHTKGSVLVNKKTKDGVHIPKDAYREIFKYRNNAIGESELSEEARKWLPLAEYHTATRDIRKFNRFSYDKFYVTFTYEKNAEVFGRNYINNEVSEALANKEFKKLVIIRNETDLIYYQLYDENNKLIRKKSLNVIDGYDYAERLKSETDSKHYDKVEFWNYENSAKDIRNTYIQMAVGHIAKIAAEENAIIICERVGDRKRREKSGLDNQAYIGFEEALQKKLSDLYIKTKETGEKGHVSNPMQLALSTDDAMKYSHNGIVYKLIPNYVSSMCPVTGYVNLFDFRNIKKVEDKREFLDAFDLIAFNEDASRLRFGFDYENFSCKSEAMGMSEWELQIGGRRVVRAEDKSKAYEFVDNVLESLVENLAKIDIDASGYDLLNNLDKLPGSIINEIFQLFRSLSLYTIFRYKEDCHFISPVLGELDMTPSEVTAANMLKKFEYDNNNEKNSGDYTSNWLLYAQGSINN